MGKYTETIRALDDAFARIVPGRALTQAIIRSVFIKYAADNYLYADTKDEMVDYANLQKSIASRDPETFVSSIAPILEMIDIKVKAGGVLSGSLSGYTSDYLGQTFSKRYDSVTPVTGVIEAIVSFECEENDDSSGIELYDDLKEYIYSNANRPGRIRGEWVTQPSMNRLASELLQVKEQDTYLDFSCGFGLSAIEVAGDSAKEIYLSDINRDSIQIAMMLNIIRGSGFDRIHIKVADALKEEWDSVADRAFSDFPLNYRLNRYEYGYGDATSLVANKMADSLKDGGIGILTCAPSFLFRNTRETSNARNELLSKRMIKAVISLPPLAFDSGANIIFLVLSKEKNDDVVVIDATNNRIISFSNNARSSYSELLPDGISKIGEIVANKEEIAGVSKIVKAEELIRNNTIVPAKYVDVVRNENELTLNEINDRLSVLYKRLIGDR